MITVSDNYSPREAGAEVNSFMHRYYKELAKTDEYKDVAVSEGTTSLSDRRKLAKERNVPIFICLFHFSSVLSTLIAAVTHDEYTHSAISFDTSLTDMYSFGKFYPNNPVIGRFVHESLFGPTYNQVTKHAVYVVFVTPEEKKIIKDRLDWFIANKGKMRYNYEGLLHSLLHIPEDDTVTKYAYLCSEFVASILKSTGRDFIDTPANLVKPNDFQDYKWTYYLGSGEKRAYDQKAVDKRLAEIMKRRNAGDEAYLESVDPKTRLYPVYVQLFATKLPVDKLIRAATRSDYSHATIALDPSMNNMYSFASLPYTKGILGGDVSIGRESIWSPWYQCCRFFTVLVTFVDKKGREAIQNKIDYFIKHHEEFDYNTIGCVEYFFGQKNFNNDERAKTKWFCSEFVAACLDTGGVEGHENIYMSPGDLAKTPNMIEIGTYTLDSFDEKDVIKKTKIAEKQFRRDMTLNEAFTVYPDSEELNETAFDFFKKIPRTSAQKEAVHKSRITAFIDWKELADEFSKLFPKTKPELRFNLIELIVNKKVRATDDTEKNVTNVIVKEMQNIRNKIRHGFIRLIDSVRSLITFRDDTKDISVRYPDLNVVQDQSSDQGLVFESTLNEYIHTSQLEDPDERKAMMKKYGLRPAGYGQDTRKEDEERMKKSHEWEKKIPLRQRKKIYREDGEGLVPGHEEVGDPDDVLPIEETVEYRLTKGFNKTITLYHGSPVKLTRIDAKSINLGTRISAPRTSSFWTGNKDAAAIRGLNAWMCDNIYEFYTSMDAFENIAENMVYVNKSEYDALCKKIKNCAIYVHEVIVPTKYVGRGHDPILKEYTLDIPVFPRRVYTYTYTDLIKFIKPVNAAELSEARRTKNKTSIMDKLLYDDMNKRGEAIEIDLHNAYSKLTLPKEPKPTSNGWYGDNHVWNSLIVRGNKRYRERVEVLVHREDKVLLRIKSSSTYSIPGGSSEPGRSLKDQAIKECQEEVHVTPKDLIYYGSYVKPYMNSSDYDWYICHYFVGKYDKPYTGKVRKEDQDDKMLKESKWYPVSEVDTMLSDAHLNALYDYWSRTITETAVSDDTKGTDQDFHNVGKAAGWYKGWTADGCQFDLEGVAQDNDAPDSGADGAYRVEAPVDSQDEPWLGTIHNLNNPDKSVNESTCDFPDKVLADPTNPVMVDKYRKLGYEFDPSRGTIRGRAQYMYYGIKINEPAEEPKFTIDIDQSGKGVCTDLVLEKLKVFIESRLKQVSTDNPESNSNIAKELLYVVDLIETYLINNVDKRSVYYCELINMRTLAIDYVAKVTETDASVVYDHERAKQDLYIITDGKLTTML
nr:MAG TPA: cysteine peptidase [Caudoviricetes sp.]